MKAATLKPMPLLCDGNISIHAAREGGDDGKHITMWNLIEFQSTPPVKAATNCRNTFYVTINISIHAAREGGDKAERRGAVCGIHFNPRRP